MSLENGSRAAYFFSIRGNLKVVDSPDKVIAMVLEAQEAVQ